MKALQKLAPQVQSSASIRGANNDAGDFWLIRLASGAAQPSLATGRESGSRAKGRGKGRKLGFPRGH
eukprot:5713049-Pyramimonas_sp.AAC.1